MQCDSGPLFAKSWQETYCETSVSTLSILANPCGVLYDA